MKKRKKIIQFLVDVEFSCYDRTEEQFNKMIADEIPCVEKRLCQWSTMSCLSYAPIKANCKSNLTSKESK